MLFFLREGLQCINRYSHPNSPLGPANSIRVMKKLEGHLRKFDTFVSRGISHWRKRAACPKFDMDWLHRSPIPVGRSAVISSLEKGGRVGRFETIFCYLSTTTALRTGILTLSICNTPPPSPPPALSQRVFVQTFNDNIKSWPANFRSFMA